MPLIRPMRIDFLTDRLLASGLTYLPTDVDFLIFQSAVIKVFRDRVRSFKKLCTHKLGNSFVHELGNIYHGASHQLPRCITA